MLEADLVASDPGALGLADFFEREWRKYGPPVPRTPRGGINTLLQLRRFLLLKAHPACVGT